ncbi:phospholipase B1, membrane-associated-like isoform X2 [Watersipora subatra]|uniref:phospholipase B1, membrane-associated-like isoform X2 n=1 Tax=Watersipora subatra TaxID=2589382 RepID=UPI00355C51CA
MANQRLHVIATAPTSPSLHSSFRRYVKMLHTINNSPLLKEEWNKFQTLDRSSPLRRQTSLNCPNGQRSSTQPTSVHKLRAGDIDVIAALGDSLTAGNGVLAWTVIGCLTEYRGRSWSIGGDNDYLSGTTTLPNIMKQFNPNLIGASTGSGNANSAGANLNVAVAGAIAQDMPTQARNLVNKLTSDSRIDLEKDWKMVTLFIGGNNLCDFCSDLIAHSAETMIANVAEALDILRDNIPRLYVNLLEIFDISPIAGLGDGIICGLVHGAVCSCGTGSGADKAAISELSRAYQIAVRDLVESGRYDGREDFTVVTQSFFRETTPPAKSDGSPDLSYFAPDCFHFSEKGQNIAGRALWNNLIEPLGAKSIDWGLDQSVRCPMTTYLPTKQNS